MTYKIFTTGYTGKKVNDLKPLLEWLDAILIDIRFAPFSRQQHWQKDFLQEILRSRYYHVQNLGNKAYKEGRIEILNLESGINTVLSSNSNVVLMCGCADLKSCHRFVLMNELRKLGFDVEEIEVWKCSEPTLFD
ncbi:MAG TPA: hypothetical protein PKY82_35380 [Pyrinomonadaceae bacterium]|nr:hypothetical protein [Pyrinomonadaceae bacterium]